MLLKRGDDRIWRLDSLFALGAALRLRRYGLCRAWLEGFLTAYLYQILGGSYVDHLLDVRLHDVRILGVHLLEVKDVKYEVKLRHDVVEPLHHFVRVLLGELPNTHDVLLGLREEGNTPLGCHILQLLLCKVQIGLKLLHPVHYFHILGLAFEVFLLNSLAVLAATRGVT